MTAPSPNPSVDRLLREAARWLLLARLFEVPSDRWRRDVAVLADEVDDPEVRAAARAALASATEGRYHSAFGPGGPAPPREVSYRDTVELGSIMSEITGYYRAFGYEPGGGEPPDHVAVEIGFLAYLRLKEAHALASGSSEHAAMAHDAASRFCADHLAVLGAPLAALLGESDTDYLVLASSALSALAGPPPSRTRLPMVEQDGEDGESGFACGEG